MIIQYNSKYDSLNVFLAVIYWLTCVSKIGVEYSRLLTLSFFLLDSSTMVKNNDVCGKTKEPCGIPSYAYYYLVFYSTALLNCAILANEIHVAWAFFQANTERSGSTKLLDLSH